MKGNRFSKKFYCPKCLFSLENNAVDPKLVVKNEAGEVVFQLKTCDDMAAYNIAKRGFENVLETLNSSQTSPL